ncbi:hypothetical protein QYF61_002197 [Mycteria americana]|uniref:RNA-directed DNA polymerase from mobile element jockey n=1 Tax=Mycteria americana TaxID=33587 RepID=A0AAN7P3L3_MYCAM|nr:hypothetical protein QYF61_002197 [Mycteria americana]
MRQASLHGLPGPRLARRGPSLWGWLGPGRAWLCAYRLNLRTVYCGVGNTEGIQQSAQSGDVILMIREQIMKCQHTPHICERRHQDEKAVRAKPPQLPQPLLIRLLLQTLHQLRCPSLDTLQHLNVSLVVGGPKLNTVFEAAFQPLFPKPVALHGVVVAQVQDLALSFVEPHTTGPSPSIQPVQVPLQSLPTLKQINTPTQLGVVCKLTEGALDPLVQIIDKDMKQNWPQHRALGDTTCDRPPTGVNSIHHNSLGPAVQPVLYPAKSTPVQAMSSQFLQENANVLFTNGQSTVGPQALRTKIQVDANTDPPSVNQELVCELLQQLDPYKWMGPDNIHPRVLRELADVIVRLLSIIFDKSWTSGDIPEDWKKANVTPIYKKGLKKHPGNYRPISLTSVPGKVME